jgi:hypothetical protein
VVLLEPFHSYDIEDEEYQKIDILDITSDRGYFQPDPSAWLRNSTSSSPIVVEHRRFMGIIHLNRFLLVVLPVS